MAQADYVVANGTGAAVRSDLNGQLAAIVSNNSGATEPATMYAYQWWADTTAGLLKLRNSANNAWITLRELDGTLLMEDGTAAAPGLSFASDPDSGIFRGGANEFGIATNGVERVEFGTSEVVFNDGGANYDFRIEGDTNTSLFFVDASAEAVGIGTTSPAKKLDVYEASTANVEQYLRNTTINLLSKIDGTTSAQFGTETSHPLLLTTGNFERARITSAGLVGINTTTPQSPLTVGATTDFGAIVKISRTDANFNSGMLVLGNGNSTSNLVGVWRGDANSVATGGQYLNLGGYDGIVFAAGASALGAQNRAMTIDYKRQALSWCICCCQWR
jgi:hypothetical protein